MFYTPSTTQAYASISHINNDVFLGQFVHGAAGVLGFVFRELQVALLGRGGDDRLALLESL